MTSFTLTVWHVGSSMSAQIECPAFVDREDDLAEVVDALAWAQERIAHIDPFDEES